MLTSKTRVQAIKSKFENLSSESESKVKQPLGSEHLCKQKKPTECSKIVINVDENKENSPNVITPETHTSENPMENWPEPNTSYLHSKSDISNVSKTSLSRQSSDPNKKLQRSHAFRGDRNKIMQSPKRSDSCSDPDIINEADRKLSLDRLKKLSNVLETHMRIENFVASEQAKSVDTTPFNSIPDENVPKHILDQYAKVLKPKKPELSLEKHDLMTDSGVSSETENLEDDRLKVKMLKSQFETDVKTNLVLMDDEVAASTETMRLERKNPHIVLTETLKKALKQPLPAGPPPKKPPRTFVESSHDTSLSERNKRKDTKLMLEKLEQVLRKREEQNPVKNEYDIAETDLSLQRKNPKEVHYLCTEILDISQRTLIPNQPTSKDILTNCFTSLNCASVPNKSLTSLPYSRLSTGSLSNRNSVIQNAFSSDNLEIENKPRLSTFGLENRFKSYLDAEKTNLIKEPEHIYDMPFGGKQKEVMDNFVFNSESKVKTVLRRSVCENSYGVVNAVQKVLSRSMEDLSFKQKEEKIYDVPCDDSRPETPEDTPKSNFERLRLNFEYKSQNLDKKPPKISLNDNRKPLTKPKPLMIKMASDSKIKFAKSTENLNEEFATVKRSYEKKFNTERRSKRFERNGAKLNNSLSLARKDKKDQLDADRENLNKLMNEIYDTVTAACEMDEPRPSRFPTEGDSTSEDSVKLTRSLTEKRKNYVRRVSSRAAYLDPKAKNRYRHQTSICSYKSEILDNPYSTFRTWKSFRNSQTNVDKMADDSLTDFDMSVKDFSIDDKAGCMDFELPFERDKGLFDVCLLVGLNYMTGQAYVKQVFPAQVKTPAHIENLVFPETMSIELSDTKTEYELSGSKTQCYSLVLTDEKGERNYGYCRRVLPEGSTCCLPLCYCIIGKYRAPGFYYKVLKEIESHHGNSEVEINTILQQLFDTDFPGPGEEIKLTYNTRSTAEISRSFLRNSVNLGEVLKYKTLPDTRVSPQSKEILRYGSESPRYGSESPRNGSESVRRCSETDPPKTNSVFKNLPDICDVENNNAKTVLVSVPSEKTKVIKRSIDPRFDENCLSGLLDTLGVSLVLKVFGSLLLERKVILVSDNLCQLSSCMEGLQLILYPFVWQQPLISVIPSELRKEMLEAPLPMLAGSLRGKKEWIADEEIVFEEGMLIDISHSPPKLLFFQGDESSILPSTCYKTLKTTLQMESIKNQHKSEADDSKTRNVLIAEAFLRFFVDILSDFWQFFNVGVLGEGDLGRDDVVFKKEAFIKSATAKQNQFFLEWFTETAIFNHFILNMAGSYHSKVQGSAKQKNCESKTNLVDAPLPNFYEIFDERLSRHKKNTLKQDVNTKTNYKVGLNKKVKLLKSKLRDLVS